MNFIIKSHVRKGIIYILVFLLMTTLSLARHFTAKAEILKTNDDNNFEQHLTDQGFPESYKIYLRNLHEKHPNWVFKSFKTNIDWNTAINSELFIVYRNMVPANSPDSWKSTMDGAYDWSTGEWKEYEEGWVAASKEILQYYMDPRNFLNDDASIFQFYTLSYTETETEKGLENILEGTFMGKTEALLEEYTNYFMEAAESSGVSPYFLASRAVQEVSRPGGAYSGSIEGPYYNFYNIGATGDDPISAGVAYAKAQGWTSKKKSIVEGAKWIANGYIEHGQDTLYLRILQ